METDKEVRHQVLEQKIIELLKGENYDDAEKAINSALNSLKRRCTIN